MGAKVRERPRADDPGENPEYLRHVEARGCCMHWAGGCRGDVVAHHHGKSEGGGGTSLKVSDYRTVPLCDAHHAEFHAGNLVDRFAYAQADARASQLELHFFKEMVRCLEAWEMGGTRPSKIMARARVF